MIKSYPLVPMQHGMLFNSLYQPDHGVDLTHITYDLPEDVQPDLVRLAWQQCVDLHDIFRTSFQWEGVATPMQYVDETAVFPFEYLDWHTSTPDEQVEQYKIFLREDRKRGFDFTTPPLMRGTLIRLGQHLYRFVWSYHHAIIDGRASSLVIHEAFSRYEHLLNGTPFPAPEPIPYQAYVDWLLSQDWTEAEAYWRKRLAGFSETTPMPRDPQGESDVEVGDQAEEQKIYLSADTTSKLRIITKQHNITFNTMIQGAWGLLLHHYNNSDDIVFGTIRACRRSAFAGTENMIGQLINSVPIRVQITPDTSVVEWLEALRQQWYSIRPHEHAPYINIKTWSDVAKGTPLFESIALYDHANVDARLKSLGGLWAHRDIDIFFKTDSPISLYAHGGERMLLSIYYERDQYRDASVTRMLQQLEQIFTAFANDPTQPIDKIGILSAEERDKILYTWNETAVSASLLPDTPYLHDLISRQAQTHPNTVAVVANGRQLTYAELEQQANQLAHYLRQQQDITAVPIGICLDRSVEMSVALLAVLKAGSAYVPIDATLPTERLNFIASDAQLPFVITDKWLPQLACQQLVCWDEENRPLFNHRPTTPPPLPHNADQPAYIIYTSGSTGQPKGVLCHHRGVINLLDDFNRRAPLAPAAHHSLWTNTTFDVSVYEIFSALTTGGTLHIVPNDLRANSSGILDWLHEYQIESAYLPPFLLPELASWLKQTAITLPIKRLLVGVEPILETTLARIQAHLPQGKILNGYGPTEATVCVTLQEFTTTTPQAKPLPIGRPMQNTEIYLLNKQLEPVPVGIAGELYIGGAGLAHGYWRRPELTARSFIDSPFIPGERLYKTGDLAHYMPDGTIEFIGRADFQVKVRGYRVELGEIEATLLQHPSIKQTVVVTRKDPVGNSYLVAYLVAEEGEGVGETAVRNFLLHKLPDYMVPSAFVTLDTLPLTPSDKIDRKALPAVALQSSGTKPQTPLEAHVAQTYASVLGLENVGRSDSFLLLGGHSLLATQVVSRLNQSLNIDLPLSAIFTRPKVSDLAEVIADLQTTSQKTAFTITPAPPNQPIPLSFAQQRLWFLQQLDPTDTSYNIPLALKLEGELNIPALEQSLNEIIRRHDALRTIFPATENEAYQVIKPHTRFHLPIIEVPHSDLAGWRSPNAKDLSCLNLIQQEAKKPFDLTQSSFRFQLLRINPIHHILLCTTHHIISDGWSHAIFTRELAALYEACSNNQPSPLAPLPVQYGDYAHAQRQWLQGKTLDKLVTYWRNKLADAPAQLDLPTDFTRPAVQTHSGGHHRHQLDAQLSQSLRHLCATNDATLFMGLLAAFKMLLHRLSQQDDIVIGTPIANRNQLETEQLIGFFINTLVLRTELESNQSFAELLTAVRTTTLDAYAHQDLPFEKLVETLQPDRDLGQTPFFQVFFNMVNVPAPETALGDITLTQLPWSDVSAKFDMTLYVTEDNDAITLELVYNRDLFSSERMAIFLNQYASLLNQISQAPNAPLASYTLATPAVTLPVPTQPLPPIWETPAHEWLTRHAQTQPHKIAVRDSHRALTYAELERQSNALAHNLLEQGIIQGDVVAIFAARSVDLLTAVCAIHKANAAFLILDPAYPASRLRDNLQIAAPKAWLNLSTDPISPLLTTHLQHIPQIPLTNQSANKPINQSTNPNDLAYIAFTSGTSGKSRAIAGTHQPLAHFWAWHTQTFALGASDQFTMLSGLAHDPLLRDLFTPIVAGGTLHIPNSDTLYAPDRLANWLQDRAITVTHLTPALGQIVAAGSTNLPPLRYAFFGGETLTENVVASLQQLAPQARCINFYGTTETPQAMGFYDTAAGFGKTAVPLGHGIDGVQLLILTHDHQLAGVGELGQIAIRTPYLAQGYLGENELTATKFIPNPFVADPPAHDCIYLTGDNGRFLPNGTIEYAGRSDSQINLRGVRIELSDIEATLTQHTAIAQAIVRPHNNQLIAYLVNETRNSTENTDTKHPRHPLSAPQHPTITQHIQQHLPTHMHPTTYITLDTLTLTPNGKIDLTALPTPDTTLIKTEFAAPTTPTEKQLAAIWTVVLNHNTPISLHDNFFALGGHSLLGTQVISRIRQQLGVELPLQTIFTAPTIAQLAREVEQATPTASDAITPQPEQPHYPLSFAQQRLWFLHQLEPDNTGYTIGTAVSLRGTLNIPALTQSLNALIQRHESLRTTFTLIDNQPRQIVNRFEPFELEIEVVDKTAVLPTLIDSHQRHPFDLAAPLARFKLLHCAPDHHILLINLHHIIADGWSATVLLNELRQAYAAHTSSSDWAPIPLPIQYRDFAHWQQHNNQLDQQLAYWANQLSGDLPVIDLPTDAPRPPQQTFVGAKQTHTLTADLTNGLQQLSQAHNATPFMTLLATFKLLLHRLTHQSEAPADIIVGSPIANRTRQETEALIGFFANTLVLRTQFDSNTPFADLLDAVRTTTLDAYAHQDLPFEQLVEALQPTRDLSRPPLFQIFFNMINVADYGNFDLPGLKTEPLSGDTIVAKFDLTLYVIDTDNTLKLEAVYNRDLFSQARIAALLEQYVGLLTQICQAPTQSLSNFSLHTETAVLPNPTLPLPARWHTPAHVRLSQLAQQQPHKIAIVQGDLRCDYAELEACSNQLAHYLLEQGIQKGDVVAVLAERTAVLPVTLLAIHKAGAAFTLLDPAYPPQRLLTSLKLAQPALLLHLSNKTPQPELAEGVLHNLLLQQAQLPSIPLHQYPNTPIHQSTSPTDLAYIAFTSGTTGQPRAIRGTHQPLAHFWQWHQATFGFTTTDQFTMLSGLAHDPLLRDIFTPLTVGGTLHIPENGRLLDPAYLANWLNDHAITITHLTPALSQIITATNTPLPTLRHAFFGGDTLTPAVAHSFHTAVPQALLTNFYGTTETPQAIAYHSITDPATTTTIPLGHGIDGAQLLVLTPDHQLAGIGESGEIAVRSPYLAAGYLDNDLTAAKFILNPFIENPTPEDRLYLTGDNGRFLPNGTVEFTGRADNQLNLRGYRIEPSEIEAALTSHPTIHQALVTLHNNTHLIAYTINTPPTNTSKTENHPRPPLSAPHSKTIIQHLQQHLPIYMLPHAIIPLNTRPLTPHRKKDHPARPHPPPKLTPHNPNHPPPP
ncbi:MAG: amino acid adenylation domain-containing protein, partial [Chloroflexota bacterium]